MTAAKELLRNKRWVENKGNSHSNVGATRDNPKKWNCFYKIKGRNDEQNKNS